MRMFLLTTTAAMWSMASMAHAEPKSAPPPPARSTPSPSTPGPSTPGPSTRNPDRSILLRSLSTAAAIGPGVALHGLGHLVSGDLKTARRLFLLQGAGLGLASIGGTMLYATGASRHGNEVSIPLVVSGLGLFVNSYVADIYGTASGGVPSLRYHERPAQSASLSYAFVYDPQFSYRNFTLGSARFAWGNFVISPRFWVAVDADNQRAHLPVRYDTWRSATGERLSLASAVTLHHFGDGAFSTGLFEASLTGRVDLTRISANLSGSFATAQVGYGVERIHYDIDNVGPDYNGLLLSRFSYGFYLPHGGELESYYDHRRDGFAGGLSPSRGNGSGFLGHIGLQLRQPISKQFSLRAGTELGSAWVLHTGVEVKLGAGR